MLEYYNILKDNTLFNGISQNEFETAIKCLDAHTKDYSKNEIIRQPETEILEIGIVLKGLVYISKVDFLGERTILNEVETGQTFGESLAIVNVKNSPISITAAQNSTIAFIPIHNLINKCSPSCVFHEHLMKNLIKLLAEKNLLLQIKNDILAQKTTRQKLFLYFEYASKSAGSKNFRIHFSREELADFLSLNASAMSRELCKMRDEGLLTFKRNYFALKKDASKKQMLD